MYKFLILGVIILGFCFCQSVKYSNPKDFPGTKISFGNGGGFAGTYKEYVLCENGQLFYRTREKVSYAELENVEKQQARQVIVNYNQLSFADLAIDDPGNLYYFIHFTRDDHIKKLVWGGIQQKTPEALKVYYRNLMHIVKDKHPIK